MRPDDELTLELSAHASRRTRQRHIPIGEIRHALVFGRATMPNRRHTGPGTRAKVSGRLMVIFQEHPAAVRIITVYWDDHRGGWGRRRRTYPVIGVAATTRSRNTARARVLAAL